MSTPSGSSPARVQSRREDALCQCGPQIRSFEVQAEREFRKMHSMGVQRGKKRRTTPISKGQLRAQISDRRKSVCEDRLYCTRLRVRGGADSDSTAKYRWRNLGLNMLRRAGLLVRRPLRIPDCAQSDSPYLNEIPPRNTTGLGGRRNNQGG